MKFLKDDLKNKLYRLLKEDFAISIEDIQFSVPSNRKFGDLSTTIPFIIAKREKEKAFIIGTRIIEKIKNKFNFIFDIELANGGFLNFYLKKDFLLKYLIKNINRKSKDKNQKTIVEHTSINPNKSAHIGHLRNSCLGDTLAKSLKYLGYEVEIQNYIDDTGIQLTDVVWGLLYYKNKKIEDIKKIKDLASYLWELYPEVNKLFEKDSNMLKQRTQIHEKIEKKTDPEYEVSNYISQEVLKDHIRVMDRIGIRYDLLVRESDIIELDFFKEAADIMKKKGVMYLSKDSDKKGCWVIKYNKENIEKIIIRSNNTVTYIGKDIAYTLWKVGLFKKDFYFRKFSEYNNKKEIFITYNKPDLNIHGFGNAVMVYNVIDTRQSYLQNIISQVLDNLTGSNYKKKQVHFSYEMVALTPMCVKELGFEILKEEGKKPYIEVSGRKGIAIKADELIEKLIEKSLEEVKLRHPEMEDVKIKKIAKEIAIGALRYFMVKFNSNSVIAFDFKDALSFEGDTGPYLQYTLVRTNSILKKLKIKDFSIDLKNLTDISILSENEFKIYYEILLDLSLIDSQIEFAIYSNELSVIAKYTYSLCQKFNHYYHLFSIVSEQNKDLKNLRISLILLLKNKLEKLYYIMGIPIPEKM